MKSNPTDSNKSRLILFLIFFNLFAFITIFAQESKSPIVRTRWTDPDGRGPSTYKEWKDRWEKDAKGFYDYELMYHSPLMEAMQSDSFEFGEDYAYLKGYVYKASGSLCYGLPPQANFIVYLNGNDDKILTDEAPRWTFGDPNISGQGWYGIELGNFDNPIVTVGDSFSVVFSHYDSEMPEQGKLERKITDFIMLNIPIFNKLYLRKKEIPFPPGNLKLEKTDTERLLRWNQESGVSYTIYRRSLNDTLITNLTRFQYNKIAEDIIDSVYTDSTCMEDDVYGYIIFAKDLNNGLLSGHSQEVYEEILYNKRVIYVQPGLYNNIQNKLHELAADWEEEGAEVIIYSASFTNHTSLRNSLRSIKNLEGALLIGDFPVPWFQYSELTEDSTYHYQEFPCDLYYMDLDGIWQDNYTMLSSGELVPGTDGIYDTHLQDYPRNTRAPEIIVGRITPTTGMGEPAEVINFYLGKCHNYRQDIGHIRQEFKALAFPDDDWHEWGNGIATEYISQLYTDYISIYDIDQTSAVNYKDQLDENFSLIHLWAHSWSSGHSFKVENGNLTEWFHNYEIVPANANANFYVLFACGNSRYVDDNYCGGVYALLTETGVNSFGSTHSGGMLEFPYFYERLAEGISFGKAFLKTYQYVGKNGFDDEICHWYYGLTFNGDPFIVPMPSEIFETVENKEKYLPQQLTLSNYPNPFNAQTNFKFEIFTPGRVKLCIYNLKGEIVRLICNNNLEQGIYNLKWDGTDASGHYVSSGIYICQLQKDGICLSKKVLLVK